jgi:hypothetical protein
MRTVRGSCWERIEEEDGRAAGERVFYTARKRRLARARALPNAEAAIPRGQTGVLR